MAFKYLSAALLALATLRSAYGAALKRATCAGGQSVTNAACCVWFDVLDDLQTNMFDQGECGDGAHTALRLAFHDAIGFSPSLGGGGADGSVIVFSDIETAFDANAGIDDAVDEEGPILARHNVTPGDFIQFAAAISLSNCPGAPQVQFLMGRPPPKAASPDGLIPEPFDSVQKILARMGDAGLTPTDTVALLASHSVAGADHVDENIPGTPFDSTPSLMDTQFFIEVQLRGTAFPGNRSNHGEVASGVPGEMRLQSDHLLARDSATNCIWQSFVGNQARLQSQFKTSMAKLAVLGHNPATLTDCSDVIPVPPPLPANAGPHLPPGHVQSDVEQACATAAFPAFPVQPGPPTPIPPIPQ